MSSCAASCCTCCRTDSCASATSASWPTGNALRSCHYASAYSRVQQKTYSQSHRLLPIVRTFHTLALPGLRRDYARRRAALRGSTSSTSLATPSWIMCGMKPHLHPRPRPLAAAYTQSLCLVWLRLPSTSSLCDLSGQDHPKLADTSPTACDLHNPLHSPRKPPDHPQTYAKYIDSHLPGRLPSSRCIRSAPSNTAKQRPLDYRGRSRYSPRTSGPRQWESVRAHTEPPLTAAGRPPWGGLRATLRITYLTAIYRQQRQVL